MKTLILLSTLLATQMTSAYSIVSYSCIDPNFGAFEVEVLPAGQCKLNFLTMEKSPCDVRFATFEDTMGVGNDYMDLSNVEKVITINSSIGYLVGYCNPLSF